MRYRLSTLILFQVIIALILGWWVHHMYRERAYRAEREAFVEEIMVRDLNAQLLEAIIAARTAKSSAEIVDAGRAVSQVMTNLIDHGPKGKVAMSTCVEAWKVGKTLETEMNFGVSAPHCLAAVGREGLPFILGMLQRDDPEERDLASWALQILLDPEMRQTSATRLTSEDAQKIERAAEGVLQGPHLVIDGPITSTWPIGAMSRETEDRLANVLERVRSFQTAGGRPSAIAPMKK